MGLAPSLLIAAIVIGIFIAVIVFAMRASAKATQKAEAQRRELIYAKYGQTETADKIINKRAWIGQTAEQLIDSIGRPLDIDQKVLKTKKKEVWKYVYKGANRYGYKFTLDNDVVVGWDEKM